MKRVELFLVGILASAAGCEAPPTGTATLHDPGEDSAADETQDRGESEADDDSPSTEPPVEEDEMDDGADAEAPSEEFQPTNGAWVTVTETMPMDGCSMEDWVLNSPGDPIDVEVVSDSDFEIVDSRVNLQCEYDEWGFDCMPSLFTDTTTQEDFGLNATLVLNLETWGDFDGPGALTMHTDISASCSGPDCWLVALATSSFPCEMSLITEAEAR